MKKLFIGSAIALLTTVPSAAAAVMGADDSGSIQNRMSQTQQVTKPAPLVDSPVQRKFIIAGPVTSPDLAMGPVLKSDEPIVGSYDWMAQEKAAKDQLRLEAAQAQAVLEETAARTQSELEAEITHLETVAANTKNLNETLVLVKNQIGITPWVLGGSTTTSWDCSGLVRWAYAQIGVDLYHSATWQRYSGEIISEPKIGDLVSFNHKNYSNAYHVGIYIGPDEMLHSGGRPGDRTEIRSIIDWAKDNGGSEVVYTRIIETNN